jgi:hypothetical protein
MSNDKAAFFTHTLSYPMIAYLLLVGKVPYNPKLESLLLNFCWEDIYKKFKNNYDKSVKFVIGELKRKGENVDFINKDVKEIYRLVCSLDIKTLGEFQK